MSISFMTLPQGTFTPAHPLMFGAIDKWRRTVRKRAAYICLESLVSAVAHWSGLPLLIALRWQESDEA